MATENADDGDRQMDAVIVASQINTLALAVRNFAEELSWKEAPPKEVVQAIQNLVQIVADKAGELLALIEGGCP